MFSVKETVIRDLGNMLSDWYNVTAFQDGKKTGYD